MTTMSRRAAIAATAGLLAWGTAARAQPVRAGLRRRKDLATLTLDSPDLVALRTAMEKMREPGPLSWQRQVEIHAGHFGQHRTWKFFPWHRAQLHWFERIVARASGYADFALPYLNWDHDRIPALFLDRTSPFWRPRDVRDPTESMSRWAAEDENGPQFSRGIFTGFRDFFGFPDRAGATEGRGHAVVHNFVGGDMGRIETAPRDLLFWCHHANVDRLWSHRTNRRLSGWSEDWLGTTVEGFVDEQGRPVRPTACRDLLDTARLGYDYQDLTVIVAAAPPSRGPMVASPMRALVAPPPPPGAAALRTLTLALDGPAAARVRIPGDMVPRRRGRRAAPRPPAVQAFVDLGAEADSGYAVRFLLTEGRAGPVLARDAVFGVAMGHMGTHGPRHYADLTDLWAAFEGASEPWLSVEVKPSTRGEAGTATVPPIAAASVVVGG